MVIVFYCYGVRISRDNGPLTESVIPMFFPIPPHIGQVIKLSSAGVLAEICQIDHYRMVIEAKPTQIVEVVR